MLAYVEVLVAPLWQIPEFESKELGAAGARLLHPQRQLQRRPGERARRLHGVLAHVAVQRARRAQVNRSCWNSSLRLGIENLWASAGSS